MKLQEFHGLLPVRKPSGMVSKDVSRFLIKHLGKVKIGHVGTLDPMAEGVLPVLFGKATRLQDFLLDSPKTYEMDIAFGYETDTLDADGEVVKKLPADHLTKEKIEASIESMIGVQEQVPPLYSAVKYKGRPLYDYARKGQGAEVPLEDLKRQIEVYSFKLVKFNEGVATLEVQASKGTYVRVLAQTLASKVGTCATLVRLLRSGGSWIKLEEALSLEEIEDKLSDFPSLLVPIEKMSVNLPRWQLTDKGIVDKLSMGQYVSVGIKYFDNVLNIDGSTFVLKERKESIMLLDPEGRAFGLGVVSVLGEGMLQVAMKRGLR